MPLEQSDKAVRSATKTIIATKYIAGMLVKMANVELMCSLCTGFQGLRASSVTKGDAGVFFEPAAMYIFDDLISTATPFDTFTPLATLGPPPIYPSK